MPNIGEVAQEDKSVSKLEELCKLIGKLREELGIARERVCFLQERIDASYNSMIGDTKVPTPFRSPHWGER